MAAALSACSCARARKRATKAGRVPISPPSARSQRRTERGACSAAIRAAGSPGAGGRCASGGTGQANLDFYGLGDSRAAFDQPVRYTLQFAAAIAQANWQLAPKSPWSLGVRYVYANVDPKLRDTPAFPNLADRVRVDISAPTAILEYDSRPNLFTPTRGIYAETSYMASRESLGASVDFERFAQILMGWHPVTDRVTLGARGDYEWSSNGTPFFLRPFVTLRGVPAMRYQGDQMAAIEVEARWQFHGRWSVVAFGGAGTTRTSRDALGDVTQNVGSGGVGFATSSRASSGCTPASTSRTVREPPLSTSRWAMHCSGLEARQR